MEQDNQHYGTSNLHQCVTVCPLSEKELETGGIF